MRVLIWNIKFFTLNTICEASDDPMQMKTPRSAWRNHHILQTIESGNPDVFIIIENRSSPGQFGSVAEGNGAAGALLMLHYLRAQDGRLGRHSDWCLVPPLKLVGREPVDRPNPYTEVISVYYKNSTLDFRGPFLWPQDAPTGEAKTAMPPTPHHPPVGPYDAPWDNALPPGNNFAGQYLFWGPRPDYRPIDFGGAAQRNPFLTQFAERGGPKRTINIVTSHPRPANRDAVTAAAQLGSIGNIAGPGPNTVNVLCGDFNIDIAGRQNGSFGGTGYETLQMSGYSVLIQPSAGGTMVRDVGAATADNYLKAESLDNVLVAFGRDTPGEGAATADIVNMVTGAPGYPSDMANALGAIGSDDEFRQLDNYGHVGYLYGTSDHLAISTDF